MRGAHQEVPGRGPQPRRHPRRRRGDVQTLRARRDDGPLPVRVGRDEEVPDGAPARAPARPRRDERPLPPGPARLHPHVHRAQAGARADQVRPSADGEVPEGHVRRDGLPGAGDAALAPPGGLHARHVRQAAQGDGQEAARRDGGAEGQVRGRLPREPRVPHRQVEGREGGARSHRQDLGRLEGVRLLRLQQVARRVLRLGRLPDRLHEGPLPGRVHVRADLLRNWQLRQASRLRGGGGRDGPRSEAARRQQGLRALLPRRGRACDHLRPRGREGRGRGGGGGDRRRAREERPLQGTDGLLHAPRGGGRRQQARPRKPHQVRRVRLARRRTARLPPRTLLQQH